MSYRKEVKKLLLLMLEEQAANKALKRLFEITGVIAETYLKTHYPSFLNICLLKGETSTDLAKYSIKEIFRRNQKLEFTELQNFASSLYLPLQETENEEVARAYHAFVQQVALRKLIKTYNDADSVGAKIYRNIQDCNRKHDLFGIERELWGAILRPKESKNDKHLPPYPHEKLEYMYAMKMRNANAVHIPEMMAILMEILNEQETYRKALPIFDVVQLFKRYYSFISTYHVQETTPPDLSDLSKNDLKKLKKHVVDIVKQNIKGTYLLSNKISVAEAERLYQTLVDIIESWFDEKAERCSYYTHAKKYFKISNTEYKQFWSTKVDYMLSDVRNKIAVYVIEGPKSEKFLNGL